MLKLETFGHIIQYAVYLHPYSVGLLWQFFSDKAQTKMQTCSWALLWAFQIVCI